MTDNAQLTINVDGQPVNGRFLHHSDWDIEVRITTPFQNLTGASHIMAIARGTRSFRGDKGREAGEALLNGLYHLGKFIDENLDLLRIAWQDTLRRIADLERRTLPKEEFDATRKKLRESLKAGSIDAKSYQRQLKATKKRRFHVEFEVSDLVQAFFKEYFPRVVPLDTTDEVIDILEGRRNLK